MYLARTTPGNPQPQVTVIDFTRVERGEDPQTYPLQEGDVVYVPSRKGGASLWSVFRDVIWTGVGLFRLF
jgi:hypothetical protein